MRRMFVFVISVFVFGVACSTSPSREQDKAKETIGVSGGVVETVSKSARIDIPQGALSVDVGITIDPVFDYPDESETVVSQTVHQFGPEGLTFKAPVALTLNYQPSMLPTGIAPTQLRVAKLVGGIWKIQENSTVDANRHTVSTMISGFSIWGIVADKHAQQHDGGGVTDTLDGIDGGHVTDAGLDVDGHSSEDGGSSDMDLSSGNDALAHDAALDLDADIGSQQDAAKDGSNDSATDGSNDGSTTDTVKTDTSTPDTSTDATSDGSSSSTCYAVQTNNSGTLSGAFSLTYNKPSTQCAKSGLTVSNTTTGGSGELPDNKDAYFVHWIEGASSDDLQIDFELPIVFANKTITGPIYVADAPFAESTKLLITKMDKVTRQPSLYCVGFTTKEYFKLPVPPNPGSFQLTQNFSAGSPSFTLSFTGYVSCDQGATWKSVSYTSSGELKLPPFAGGALRIENVNGIASSKGTTIYTVNMGGVTGDVTVDVSTTAPTVLWFSKTTLKFNKYLGDGSFHLAVLDYDKLPATFDVTVTGQPQLKKTVTVGK